MGNTFFTETLPTNTRTRNITSASSNACENEIKTLNTTHLQKKRLCSGLLALFLGVIPLFSVQTSYAQTFSGGDGTYANPYIITTAAELAQLATFVNAGDTAYNSKQYKLANDIDLSAYGAGFNGGKGWIPIGIYNPINPATNYPFKGAFNGDSNRITGLYINDTMLFTGTGLFGNTNGASIYNLTVDNVDIRGGVYVGGLVGYAYFSSLINCSSSGNIKRGGYVGGLVGQMLFNGGILDCYSTCDVNGGGTYVGGIAGAIEEVSKISNCFSTGNVYGSDFIGGIVGTITRLSVLSYCYSTGDITGNQNIGGIAGNGDGASLTNCYSIGSVTGNRNVGGILGEFSDVFCCNLQTTIDCIALNLSVKGNSSAGRVIGNIINDPMLSNMAFDSILTQAGDVLWLNKGADDLDGEDITKGTINADGTLGGRFTNIVWTTQNGKLPGLFGKTVDMPPHLRINGDDDVSIKQLTTDNEQLTIYPNPTSGKLTVISSQLSEMGNGVVIYDVVGQVVSTSAMSPQSPEATIDISHLANGLYFLKIDKKTIKIMKQ